MHCRICGEENGTRYYESKRQTLCRSCSKDAPAKVGREEFDRKYWAGCNENDPPNSVRRDFYEDYLASRHGSVKEYQDATTSDTL